MLTAEVRCAGTLNDPAVAEDTRNAMSLFQVVQKFSGKEAITIAEYFIGYKTPLDRIDKTSKERYGLLHKCIRYNRMLLLCFFLKHGAPTELRDKTGATALHLACRLNLPVAVRFLAGAGADQVNCSGT